jgi:hypothetical protein
MVEASRHPGPARIFQELVAAAGRGCEVRVLLRPEASNSATLAALNKDRLTLEIDQVEAQDGQLYLRLHSVASNLSVRVRAHAGQLPNRRSWMAGLESC